jgi:putative membrane protein
MKSIPLSYFRMPLVLLFIMASDVGQAFLGSQGDIWDAQWDMFLAFVGAAVVLPILSRFHDRSMAKLSRDESSIN